MLIDNIELIPTSKITLSPEVVLGKLKEIYDKTEYKLIFSDKTPKGTLGDYRFKEHLITLYYNNLNSDYDLIKTAIHELAHHIDFVKYGYRQKPHTGTFRDILNYAEVLAVDKGILIEKESPSLEVVFDKAMDFGESILNYVKIEEDQHLMDALQKKLYGISKKSIRHFCSLYNTFKV